MQARKQAALGALHAAEFLGGDLSVGVHVEPLEGLLAGELDTHHVQRRFQRQDSALVCAITSMSRVPGAPGGEQLLVLVAADITEQRHAEQSLARARAELAQVARVSTLGELTASIAHEVNQPLMAVVTNGEAGMRWLRREAPVRGWDCGPANTLLDLACQRFSGGAQPFDMGGSWAAAAAAWAAAKKRNWGSCWRIQCPRQSSC